MNISFPFVNKSSSISWLNCVSEHLSIEMLSLVLPADSGNVIIVLTTQALSQLNTRHIFENYLIRILSFILKGIISEL